MRSRFFIILLLAFAFPVGAEVPQLENPMSRNYLETHLTKESPRLVFTPEIVQLLQEKVRHDPVVKNMYSAVKLNADAIREKPLLKRKMVGRRLLGTSREMLYRINMLGAVYLVEGDPDTLVRINEEVLSVCAFKDWNPSHFLDTAEMAMAVSLALDWTMGELPAETVQKAKTALMEKALMCSWPENGERWKRAYGENNWNQVCNGGLIAAAITIAQEEPELAAKTIRRALEGLPNVLVSYGPDGVYPEGSTYWGYGTSFSIVTAAMLESSFGTDFGHYEYPGFKESAMFRLMCNAPSGWFYNFADCGDQRGRNGDVALAWFAVKSGTPSFFEKERFLRPADEMGKLSRLDGAGLAWLSRYEARTSVQVPNLWKGEGTNPIVIFRGGENDPHRYYFGGKGGRATTSHGNMDAGSFVFELNGIRWVIDPGNQSYNELEKTGFNLWSRGQNSQRWTLLTKNNFGHSTLTINNQPFVVDGFASLIDFKGEPMPEAAFDLSAVYGKNVRSAVRRFRKDGPSSLVVEDHLRLSEYTEQMVWQLMTVAAVEPVEGGAILSQDGKVLKLEVLSHPNLDVNVIPLYPAPLKLDRQIEGLKRVEINIPVSAAKSGSIEFIIRMVEGE